MSFEKKESVESWSNKYVEQDIIQATDTFEN
jgi:hypothetical protein